MSTDESKPKKRHNDAYIQILVATVTIEDIQKHASVRRLCNYDPVQLFPDKFKIKTILQNKPVVKFEYHLGEKSFSVRFVQQMGKGVKRKRFQTLRNGFKEAFVYNLLKVTKNHDPATFDV